MVHKLAIFDVDGTIAHKGAVASTIYDGFKHLHELGYTTTISTGRSYPTLKYALGEKFSDLISDDALLILEHGSRLVNKSGKIVFTEAFTVEEIDHIIDFMRANIEMFRLAWFSHPDPEEKMPFWCSNEVDVFEEAANRPYAETFTCSLTELKNKMLEHPISNVELKLYDHIKVHNLLLHFTRTPINVMFMDGNMGIIKNNINKSIAVRYVANKLGIDMNQVMVAGNAINDAEMLSTGSGTRILVGPRAVSDLVTGFISEPEELVRIESPEALGDYLRNLES